MDAKPCEAKARSFVNGYMTSFFDLPVGSIFRILSLTSPQDVCRVSTVSSAFQFAADSDCVWKGFLPSDHEEILSRASCAISFSSMK
ncbi:hypothetical protein Syun_014958 [Stephania yunnanensis]|uniref:F-box domain-containing protein n=1 Tax=Stephania yunnanensis TaxID=152371 RepID=A0AAP0JKA8_9MAGN